MSMFLRSRAHILLFFFSLPAFAGTSVPGIKNFYQVDAHVYRGGQPTHEGFDYLAKIGVKIVIDLREDDNRSPAERRAVTAAGMQYVNVPMTGLIPPTEAQTNQILALLQDDTTGPIFVHCKRGADRTGAVIAAYRINHNHWDNTEALREAMSHGMSFFQLPRQHYVRTFQPRKIEATPADKLAMTTAPATGATAPAIAVP